MTFSRGIQMGALAAALAGCGADRSPAGSAEARSEGASTVQAPLHDDQHPWRYPTDDGLMGTGRCAGVSLATFLEDARRAHPELHDIRSYRPSSPGGITLIAGGAIRADQPAPPPTGTASFVSGLSDDEGFGAIFFRGTRCRGEPCEDREVWYFESDPACRVRWAGHYRAMNREGGHFGRCTDEQGVPLWHWPVAPDPRQRCDADWSPQSLGERHPAWSLDPIGTCGTKAGPQPAPVEVVISQGPDPAFATAGLTGTGIPFLEGRAFAGKVERRRFEAMVDEPLQPGCDGRRRIQVTLDFEGPSINGIPGGFGLVEIQEKVATGCPEHSTGCSASLHLIRRE